MNPDELRDYICETADICRVCGKLPKATPTQDGLAVTVRCCFYQVETSTSDGAVLRWNKHQRGDE